jgi:hypothetical protein
MKGMAQMKWNQMKKLTQPNNEPIGSGLLLWRLDELGKGLGVLRN